MKKTFLNVLRKCVVSEKKAQQKVDLPVRALWSGEKIFSILVGTLFSGKSE